MKNIIIIIVLLLGTNTLAVSQTDTLPRPTIDTTDFSEGYKEYTGEYTNDYPEEKKRKSWLYQPTSLEFGLGLSHIFIKDNLIAPYAYSGYGFSFLTTVENTDFDKYLLYFNGTMSGGYLSRSFRGDSIMHDDLSDFRLEYFEADIPIDLVFKLAESPHYLGFHLNNRLASVSPSSSEESDYSIEDYYLSTGVAYFYNNDLLGIPIKARASLPILTMNYHSSAYTGVFKFNTLFKHFKPTVQLDLWTKNFKNEHFIKVSYQCRYLNTNRGIDKAFRQRYFQNLINVSYGGWTISEENKKPKL